jgi:hypothetical protein
MSHIIAKPDQPFVPRFDPETHPLEYAALVPPVERPFHSYNALSGKPPTAAERACLRAHFSRYRYSRIEARTYDNGWRVACLWPSDGFDEAQKHFAAEAKSELKGVDHVAI